MNIAEAVLARCSLVRPALRSFSIQRDLILVTASYLSARTILQKSDPALYNSERGRPSQKIFFSTASQMIFLAKSFSSGIFLFADLRYLDETPKIIPIVITIIYWISLE